MKSSNALQATDLEVFQVTKQVLQVSDYQMFIEAYRSWYGHAPDPIKVEAFFKCYLYDTELPYFVRHFARNFIDTHPQHLQSAQIRERHNGHAGLFALIINFALVVGAMALY